MKIKQSFIDRCGEITVKQIRDISLISEVSQNNVLDALSFNYLSVYTKEVLKATANVLKIKFSDIYEVEDLPHTL